MATRPTISVTVRATDTNYSGIGNDLDTTPTKIERSGAELALGYVPDSPLGTYPVSAQGINYDQNRNDQWVKWVSEGSFTNSGDAHIVETDSTGDINVVGVNCGEIRMTPNIGTDAIEVTTTGGSKGLEVIQNASSTDYGVAVIAADGTAAPASYIEVRSAPGLSVVSGDKAGIVILAVANGGVIGPSIDMQASTIDSSDDSVGTMWTRTQNSIDNVKMGMGSSAGYPIIAKNAPCYARSAIIQNHQLLGSQTDEEIAGSFSWKTDQVPQDSDQVRVTIWGKISLVSNEINSVELKVRDTTAGNAVICRLTIANPDNGSSVAEQQSATFSDIYTLPSSGARSFDLVWDGDVPGAAAGNFWGYVEIEQLRG